MNEQLPDSTLTELLKVAERAVEAGKVKGDYWAYVDAHDPFVEALTPSTCAALVREVIELRKRYSTSPLSHDEAAAKGQYCGICSFINYDPNPTIYTCSRCENEGYDCCFPAGRGTICDQCEERPFG